MTDSPVEADRTHQDLTLDQQVALQAAADRLTQEFEGVARESVIQDLLEAAYEHIADHANFDNFVPLLAERYTRELLHAAATDNAAADPREVAPATPGAASLGAGTLGAHAAVEPGDAAVAPATPGAASLGAEVPGKHAAVEPGDSAAAPATPRAASARAGTSGAHVAAEPVAPATPGAESLGTE